MGGAIIGLNRPGQQNAAPNATYAALYNLVNGKTGSRYFVLNGYGESLGTSPNRAWTPRGSDGVAEFVRSGQIFIDYCGWPMYYQVSVDGTQTQLGAGGFGSFVQGVGYDWLSQTNFSPPTFTTNTFPFLRGYSLAASQNGVRYASDGTFSTQGGLFGIGGGNFPFAADGYSAMMALHHGASDGWYFYGTYGERAASSEAPSGIPIDIYAAFILACLGGQGTFSAGGATGTIAHAVYQAPTHTVTANQPGPTTPYGQGSGSSGSTSSGSHSSGSTSSGSGGVHVTTTSSGSTSPSTGSGGGSTFVAPASGPSLLEVGGLAAAAGLITLGGYLLLKK